MATRWRDALDWINGSSEEPLRLVRLMAGGLLLFGTVVAVALALSGIAPRAILLVGAFWAIYGLISGFTSGVLEPVIEGLAEALQSVGLIRAGGGYSAIETLVARGHLADAAEAYREHRLTADADLRVGVALVDVYERRLADPGRAMVELRRLIDLYPDRRATLRLRRELAILKDERRT